MTVLAAAFSLRLMRLGDLAGLAATGVALGFVIFFLSAFCGALGVDRRYTAASGGLEPAGAGAFFRRHPALLYGGRMIGCAGV